MTDTPDVFELITQLLRKGDRANRVRALVIFWQFVSAEEAKAFTDGCLHSEWCRIEHERRPKGIKWNA